jgi:hypothetical protein
MTTSPDQQSPEQTSPDFERDAEAAAKGFGFGKMAGLVRAADVPVGTNPTIVAEQNRRSVAPGGNDYASLQTPAAGLSKVKGLDEPSRPNTQPNATMTRGVIPVPTPAGTVLMDYQQETQGRGINVEPLDMEPREPPHALAQNTDLQDKELTAAVPKQEVGKQVEAMQLEEAHHGISQQEADGLSDVRYCLPGQEGANSAEAEDIRAIAGRAAAESTKRQEAELPGAENRTGPTQAGPASALAQLREELAGMKAERKGDGMERDTGKEAGRDQAAAAFRSFGGR